MPTADFPVTDPRLGYLGARILTNLDYPAQVTAREQLQDELLGSHLLLSVIAESAFPVTWMQNWSNGILFVGLSGVRTSGAMGALVRSWLDGDPGPLQTRWVNQVNEWALQIFNDRRFLGTTEVSKVVLIGHSLGGAIALPLAKLISNRVPSAPINVISYGSPRVCGRLAIEALQRTFVARYITPGDQVSSFPPLAAQAPDINALLTSAQRARIANWIHPDQALSVAENGSISQLVQDPAPTPFTGTTILQCLQSRQGIFNASHAITTYRDRLALSIPPAPANPVVIPPPPIVAQVNPPVDAQVNRVLDARLAVFREGAAHTAGVPVQIPSFSRMRAFHENRIWFVEWGGYIVCCGPTKKKARALCRHFNKFLMIYQGVGASYSQIFVQALQEYLSAAAVDTMFAPPLRDNGIPPALWQEIFGIQIAP